MKKKETMFDKFIKIGLILGLIWLGPKFLKLMSENGKNKRPKKSKAR